jgi:hypothetical protein
MRLKMIRLSFGFLFLLANCNHSVQPLADSSFANSIVGTYLHAGAGCHEGPQSRPSIYFVSTNVLRARNECGQQSRVTINADNTLVFDDWHHVSAQYDANLMVISFDNNSQWVDANSSIVRTYGGRYPRVVNGYCHDRYPGAGGQIYTGVEFGARNECIQFSSLKILPDGRIEALNWHNFVGASAENGNSIYWDKGTQWFRK